MTDLPPSDEIDSTFQELNLENSSRFPSFVTEAYEGTLVFEKYTVTHTYTVERHDHGTERLCVYAQFAIDGEEINSTEDTWELTDDGEHVQHSGETIEQFCRSNHTIDPQLDIEYVMEHEGD